MEEGAPLGRDRENAPYLVGAGAPDGALWKG